MKFAPSDIQFVSNENDSDIEVLHINGRHDQFMGKARNALNHGRKYIVMQYCLKSTKRRDCNDWQELWQNALMVFSYYDLPRLIKEDGGEWSIPNFLYSPLGADETIFTPSTVEKEYIAMTTGGDRGSLWMESVANVINAATSLKRKVFHLGPDMELEREPDITTGYDVVYGTNISDDALADAYRKSEFVSGLRRIEGFELPVVEGMFCGIRPILFDRHHYRWFERWAKFIPENGHPQVTESIKKVLEAGPSPLTKQEIAEAIDAFNWKKIVNNFWRRV